MELEATTRTEIEFEAYLRVKFNSSERTPLAQALNALAMGIQGMRATCSTVSVEEADNENEDMEKTLLIEEQIHDAI